MSEPVVYVGIGILIALLLVYSIQLLARSRVGRLAIKRLENVAPTPIADIETDMAQLHAQIAMATRRLETSVAQMRSKTTSQLSEIGKTTEAIASLKSDLVDRALEVQKMELRKRTLSEEMRTTEAELTVKTAALKEVERKLAETKAELRDLMTFVDARDKLAELESRHAAATAELRNEKAQLEDALARSREECTGLRHDMEHLKKRVESTWASERMAQALLRERINDVAGEVVRVAHALEGLGSPIDTMLAGRSAELELTAVAGGNGDTPSSTPGGDDSKGLLAHRLRSLQKRAARVASSGGT